MSKLKQEAFAKLLVKTGLSQDELKSMGIDVLEASSNEGRIVDNATRVLTNQQDKAVKKDMKRLFEIVQNKYVLSVSEWNDLIRKYYSDFIYSKKKTRDGVKVAVDCYPRLSVKIESVDV